MDSHRSCAGRIRGAVPGPPKPAKAVAKPAPQKHIDASKKSWANSQAVLRKYEWIETTVTSHKGKEKSRVVKRCYYGAEGGVQKVHVSTSPKPKKARGLRGKINKGKLDKMAAYMKAAAALVQTYLPPAHAKIQASKAAGNAVIHVVEPGKRVKIQLNDYEKPGDSLSFDLDVEKSRLLELNVKSLLGEDKDPVTLDVRLGAFPDGTIYVARTTLVAKAKELKVVVENSGYKKLTK
ncbi:MAG: hypothetical protein ACYTGZ_04140 [Planctomycetota bacterium]|jgi:hypothetical protein